MPVEHSSENRFSLFYSLAAICRSRKFGFSVQKQIYCDVGGKPGKYSWETFVSFAEQVEWKVGDKWLGYDELCWDLRGVRGHIPLWVTGGLAVDADTRVVVCGWAVGLFSRTETCRL
ncbi:MAG: GUN4 domain-containing protein [Calothrix sp. MO_167.B12]|nr:GUN4 domain-containing protein [Calothrix sp. MO_167.B12]